MKLHFKQFFDKQKQKPTYFAEKIALNDFILCDEYNNYDFPDFFDTEKMENFKAKKHAIIRDEKNQWQAGKLIHCVYVNFQFVPDFECKSVQKIEINWKYFSTIMIKIDNRYLDYEEIEQLSINEGFETVKEFFEYFNTDFKVKIIHFTELRY